jgi:hypothetical protein
MKVTKVDERTYEIEVEEPKGKIVTFKLPPKESYQLDLIAINKKLSISSLVKQWVNDIISNEELLKNAINEPDKSLGGDGKTKTVKMNGILFKKVRIIAKKNNLTISELLRKIVLYNLRKIKQNK